MAGHPIAVDVMGADNGPREIIKGSVQSANDLGISVILVGDREIIERELAQLSINDPKLISIEHAPNYISMKDLPSQAIRAKEKVSVRVAFELVKEQRAVAVVSAGNTGAMLAAGLFVVGTIDGVARPAIATLIPRGQHDHPTVLLDSGANIQCNAEQLVQFAVMGKFYSRALFNLEYPRVGVLSNGTESSKGNDLTRAAAYILSNLEGLNYHGFVEGRHIPHDIADVIVCDGFIGNIVLKTMEGSVELVIDSIREEVKNSLRGKIGMYLAKPLFKKLFREKLDPSTYGGAPLLGLNGIGIVCHGSSNQKAIFNAVRVAHKLFQAGLIPEMKSSLVSVEEELDDFVYEDGMWDKIGGKFDNKKKNNKLKRFRLRPRIKKRDNLEAGKET